MLCFSSEAVPVSSVTTLSGDRSLSVCYINQGTRIERQINAVLVIVPDPLKCIDDVMIALVSALSDQKHKYILYYRLSGFSKIWSDYMPPVCHVAENSGLPDSFCAAT